jgi:hypothetical protein
MDTILARLRMNPELSELQALLEQNPNITYPRSSQELANLAIAQNPNGWNDVSYDTPQGSILEARVCRVKNGIAANYLDPYMRRRDPDCLFIGDNLPTDKTTYERKFNAPFHELRSQTMKWLETQELVVFPFIAGQPGAGVPAIAVVPLNAAFFAFGLSLLQGMEDNTTLPADFIPRAVVYVAPPFRHSHFGGKQAVVHNRRKAVHELFSYNLYPGPSAKKGVYGVLISIGEQEGWTTLHCSTVQAVTPYDNTVTFLHEGASGGGKSEMLEQPHREKNGRILFGENILTNERLHISMAQTCNLQPVTDDMALAHPSLQNNSGRLVVTDAEDAWFLRVDHIQNYGTDPDVESLTLSPKEPLLFLNIDAAPGSTALIWDHIEDEPGKRCPNPRVIVPRKLVPEVLKTPIAVDVRSFGVRAAPCTKESPSFGIFGLFHVLPPSLAWLWRLVAPRGHANPSVISNEGLKSEGVGSYWPFAVGKRVDQANLLLQQILSAPETNYILVPNQHIGAWKVGFAPQWITREYLARRGSAVFPPEKLRRARCPLLGYTLRNLTIEGQVIDQGFLRVERQPDVGVEGYDLGASLLTEFFKKEVSKYLTNDLMPLGRTIIESCLNDASNEDYDALISFERGARPHITTQGRTFAPTDFHASCCSWSDNA